MPRCPQCNHENPEGQAYCERCSLALVRSGAHPSHYDNEISSMSSSSSFEGAGVGMEDEDAGATIRALPQSLIEEAVKKLQAEQASAAMPQELELDLELEEPGHAELFSMTFVSGKSATPQRNDRVDFEGATRIEQEAMSDEGYEGELTYVPGHLTAEQPAHLPHAEPTIDVDSYTSELDASDVLEEYSQRLPSYQFEDAHEYTPSAREEPRPSISTNFISAESTFVAPVGLRNASSGKVRVVQNPTGPTITGVSMVDLEAAPSLEDFSYVTDISGSTLTPHSIPLGGDPSDQLIGQQFGNFLIEEKIGRGGFGAIYRANQVYLNQPIAIKVLHFNLQGDTEILERFRREARALAQLRHDNVVQLSDFGLLPGLGFYLAMEYLEGESLHAILKRKEAFSLERLKALLQQLCDVLGHIHAKDIVHRDMKPSNIILVKERAGKEKVKLIDFGIAAVHRESVELTQEGSNIGTAKYMSPEQVQGLPSIDGRSDLYSVSLLLFRMLSGQMPFSARNEIDLMHHQVKTPPPTLAQIAPWKDWCPELEAFFVRTLAKKPAQRPPSAAVYWEECRNALDAQFYLESGTTSPLSGPKTIVSGASPLLPAPTTPKSQESSGVGSWGWFIFLLFFGLIAIGASLWFFFPSLFVSPEEPSRPLVRLEPAPSRPRAAPKTIRKVKAAPLVDPTQQLYQERLARLEGWRSTHKIDVGDLGVWTAAYQQALGDARRREFAKSARSLYRIIFNLNELKSLPRKVAYLKYKRLWSVYRTVQKRRGVSSARRRTVKRVYLPRAYRFYKRRRYGRMNQVMNKAFLLLKRDPFNSKSL